jgi:hypothetical protein
VIAWLKGKYMKRKRLLLAVGALLIAIVFITIEIADTPTISAHAVGMNYGTVDTNIIVTTTAQKVFHFHSDFQGGGTWYDVFVGLEGKYVKVHESNSISSTDKDGKEKMSTTVRSYLFPINLITKEEIKLEMKNRIVLTKK